MGLLGSLFGGSKGKQESGNKSFDFLSGALQPAIGTGTNALGQLSDILKGGFGDFKKNAGFDFALNNGMRGITGGAAANGLLRSGGTGKALAGYEAGLGSQFYNNWLDRIGQVSQLGLGAAGTLAGAGSYSKGTNKSNGGIIPGLFG